MIKGASELTFILNPILLLRTEIFKQSSMVWLVQMGFARNWRTTIHFLEFNLLLHSLNPNSFLLWSCPKFRFQKDLPLLYMLKALLIYMGWLHLPILIHLVFPFELIRDLNQAKCHDYIDLRSKNYSYC